MAVSSRPADVADAPALAELAAETFPLACPPGTSPEAIAIFIAEHFTPGHFGEYLGDPERAVTVVEDSAGRIVGYTMLISGDPADGDVARAVRIRPTIELSKVYVRADQHGTGASRVLMAATLERAGTRDVRSVWLGVNRHNARARRFYEKSGFDVVGERTFQLGPEVHHDFVLVRPFEESDS
jgi:ribosomal protein S18 acetylase RimI-like enzyme